MSDEVVEKALAEISEAEAPMYAPSEGDLTKDAGEKTTEAQQEAQDRQERIDAYMKILRDGKEIGLDEHKAKMYAQKGFDYEKKMHQLRVDKQLFEKEREKYDESYKELKEINEYAKKNPEWERFLQEQWAQKQQNDQYGGNQQQQFANPQDQQINMLQNQLADVLSRLDSQSQEMNDRKAAELDSRLQGEIDSYKEKYSDFDWKSQDEIGLNLEQRIQQHAIDSGIKNFTAAARDYLWDEHMKRASMNSKEQVGEAVKKQNALGLGKVTKESQMQVKTTDNLRKKSYHDLAAEALAELGIT